MRGVHDHIHGPIDEDVLRALIERHVAETTSHRGQSLLADWETSKRRFAKVVAAA